MATVGEAQVKIVADARGFARDVERQVNRALREVDSSGGVREFGQRVERQVTRETRGGFRNAAIGAITSFGIVLQGGISRTAAGGFGVAVLALLVPIMAAAGAVAAGALVLGFGAAFTAIPLIVAAQNKKVEKEMARFGKEVTKLFKDLSEPFEEVWFDMLDTARRVLKGLTPTLRTAFAGLAPVISQFVDQLGDAFLELEPAIQPMIDAFSVLLEEIGPILIEEVFPDLADALINLAEAVSENAPMLADMITSLFQLVEAVINFVAELTRLAAWFNEHPEVIIGALGLIVAALIALGGPITITIGAILALGAVILFFKDEVVAAFKLIKKTVTDTLTDVGNFFERKWNDILNFFRNIGRAIVLQATTAWNGMVAAVRNGLNNIGSRVRDGFNNIVSFVSSIPGRIASVASGMWDSIVSNFKSAINGIIGAWNGLSFTIPAISAFGKTLGGSTIGTPDIPLLQEGGIIRRSGTAIVGEAGPEFVSLQRGAVVQPLPDDGSGSEGLPAEFEATAVIDLGRGVQEVIRLTFADVRRGANAGVGGAR